MEEQEEITSEENNKRQVLRPPYRVFRYTLLVFFGLFVSLLLIELLLRGFYFAGDKQLLGLTPARTTLEYYENDHIGHALIPNQTGWFVTHTGEYYSRVSTNSHGWPDIDHQYDKPQDVYRILILGDSFVENFQVPLDKRFFRQLEQQLNDSNYAEQLGKRTVEIIALGRGNTGTAQQLLILQEYGIKYSPDMVMHLFFTANDFVNNVPDLQNDPYLPYFTLTENGTLNLLPPKKRNERPYAVIKDTLKNTRIVELALKVRQNLTKQSYADYPIEYHVYDKTYNDAYKHAWELTQQLLLETKQISEENGAEYQLITLANNEQVNNNVWNALRATYPELKSANTDLEKPEKLIKVFCEENTIACHFMLPHFQDFISQYPQQTTHYYLDGHWNEVGTDLAADYVFATLMKSSFQNEAQ